MIETDIRWTTVQLNLRSWNVENLVTSEQLYREREDKLLELTSDLDVRAGQAANYVSFHDYYERNWKDCAFRWVFGRICLPKVVMILKQLKQRFLPSNVCLRVSSETRFRLCLHYPSQNSANIQQ